MIVLSAVLVLVGLALLIAGLVSTGLALIYASLGVTVVAAILLLLGVRMAPSKRGGAAPSAAAAVSAPDSQQAPAASDAQTRELEPVAAVAVVPTRAPGTVVVVSGRPRYHRAECRFLANAGDEAEDISAEEARELGFTPCGVCKPDDQHGGGAENTDTRPAGDTADVPAEPVNLDTSPVTTTDSVDEHSDPARPEETPADTASSPAKKVPAKKAPAKKAAAAKKAPATKAAAAKKAPATKAPATKAAAAKAPVKKVPGKKAPAKKAAARKAAVKKAAGRPTSSG